MGREFIQHNIKLSQNENPFGSSPKAVKAVLDECQVLNCYPEPHSSSLRTKIAGKINCDADQIFVSAGLVESLDILIRNFISDDENLVIPELSFVAYNLLANVFKKEVRLAKMKNFHVDVQDIVNLCDEKTKAIIIANPNNPTGTVISEAELILLLKSVPTTTLVVMDEAYIEYNNFEDFPDSLKLQKSYPNLLVMRTFSKIYGLAGLRVGYTVGPSELIKQFDYYQAPFTVNKMASVAAYAAIDDDEFLELSTTSNTECREKLYEKLIELDFNVIPSESNFLFVHFDSVKERDWVYDQLERMNVLIRKTDMFGEEKAFRISIGTKEMNDAVMQCFTEIEKLNGNSIR